MSSSRDAHHRTATHQATRHGDSGSHWSSSRKRPHPSDHPPSTRRPRHHSPHSLHHSWEESGRYDRHRSHHYSREPGPSHERSRHHEPSSQGRSSEATPTKSLSVDATVPNRAHHSGTVPYTGSHGNVDDWTIGNIVSGPLNTVYYTMGEDDGNKMLYATERLEELHQIFTESLLDLTLPSHASLVAPYNQPSLTGLEETVVTCTPQERSNEQPSETKSGQNQTITSLNTGNLALVKDSVPKVKDTCGSSSAKIEDGIKIEKAVSESSKMDSSEEGSSKEDSIPFNTVTELEKTAVDPGTQLHKEDTPAGPWHAYSITVSPTINFPTGLTTITSDTGGLYNFRGFMFLTKDPLSQDLPVCRFERFSCLYTLELKPLPTPDTFVTQDVLLFHEYLLVQLLEIYDLAKELRPFSKIGLFLPLFVRETLSTDTQEVLPMAEVLRYLLDAFQPLSESDSGQRFKGHLVADLSARPHCLRVDNMWHPTLYDTNKTCKFGHYHVSRSRERGHKARASQKHVKTQYHSLLQKKNKGKLSRKEHFQFTELKRKMEGSGGLVKSFQSSDLRWFSADGYYNTGLCMDVVQHVLLLSVASQYIVLHKSLYDLQCDLGYTFKDRSLLHRAVTHPCCLTTSYLLAEDHIKTALANCGLAEIQMFSPPNSAPVLKGLKGLLNSVENGDKGVRLEHNEQLEFLGDAVLEYITSMRLFLLHPKYPVGRLNQERQHLVKNRHLWELASKLGLTTKYLVYNKKVEFTEESMQHGGANCVEALLGAVFVDGGLDEADVLFARLAFSDQDKHTEWMNPGTHSMVQEYPNGDRHLIEESDELKNLLPLEKSTGVQFNHIQLLAKAFTHSSHQDTKHVRGNYQRLEFLGDAILQLLVTKHVYHLFPSHNEGHLTTLRTTLVHNKQLASMSRELGFDKCIFKDKKDNLELNTKQLADVVESYIAALTLDKGLSAAEEFLQKHLFPKLLSAVSKSQLLDPNTRLHQAAAYTCKQQGVSVEVPVYKVTQSGSKEKPEFTVSVHFEKKKVGTATAGSIRDARRLAAEEALKSSFLRIPPSMKLLQEKAEKLEETHTK